ncbi:hypothetical protein [Insolitispirillum peregrinum]|uniref:Uncharacterized protein n=1 Tax=Insolitispirillum peregrinum TaxID=80876 RepID=A0A1N7MEV0_9PROT|nr:hypothetical protein [Insolitispirillum peregrinum]SIS84665.1 hypothetical protein SAMN05421779_10482 [Insolitispirillum peregrinum]
MITIEDLSKEELAMLVRKLLACDESIARLITEWDLLDVRAAVLRGRMDRAWLACSRASELVEALSRKPNVNPQTWKRAMNKEERLFAEWQRLREQRDTVVDALNAAFDRMVGGDDVRH